MNKLNNFTNTIYSNFVVENIYKSFLDKDKIFKHLNVFSD